MQLFTLEEARAALAAVIPQLEALSVAAVGLREIAEAASRGRGQARGNGHVPEAGVPAGGEDRLASLQQQAGAAMAALEETGVVVRDPERGLIDFMNRREGRIVCLCFVLGEQDISYWHEEDAGFAGRRPL